MDLQLPQLYELLVLIRGWPLPRFTAFITDAMIAALLPPSTNHASSGHTEPPVRPSGDQRCLTLSCQLEQ